MTEAEGAPQVDIKRKTKIKFWMQGAAHVLVWCFVAFLFWTTHEAYFNYTIYHVETGRMQVMHDLLPNALARADDDSERVQELLDSGLTTMPLAILNDDGDVVARSRYMYGVSDEEVAAAPRSLIVEGQPTQVQWDGSLDRDGPEFVSINAGDTEQPKTWLHTPRRHKPTAIDTFTNPAFLWSVLTFARGGTTSVAYLSSLAVGVLLSIGIFWVVRNQNAAYVESERFWQARLDTETQVNSVLKEGMENQRIQDNKRIQQSDDARMEQQRRTNDLVAQLRTKNSELSDAKRELAGADEALKDLANSETERLQKISKLELERKDLEEKIATSHKKNQDDVAEGERMKKKREEYDEAMKRALRNGAPIDDVLACMERADENHDFCGVNFMGIHLYEAVQAEFKRQLDIDDSDHSSKWKSMLKEGALGDFLHQPISNLADHRNNVVHRDRGTIKATLNTKRFLVLAKEVISELKKVKINVTVQQNHRAKPRLANVALVTAPHGA